MLLILEVEEVERVFRVGPADSLSASLRVSVFMFFFLPNPLLGLLLFKMRLDGSQFSTCFKTKGSHNEK